MEFHVLALVGQYVTAAEPIRPADFYRHAETVRKYNWARMCWRSRALTCSALLCAVLGAQTAAPTFRTEVALVHVDAEVIEDGRVLSGFGKDDFRILDNGKPQPVLHFSAGDQALDLILLFDISGSMQAVVEAVAAAAHQALQELRAGDRVAVMVFNTRSREIAGFTEDLDAVQKTIEEDLLHLRFGGGTRIQDAVDAAALRLMHEPKSERRRAVLATRRRWREINHHRQHGRADAPRAVGRHRLLGGRRAA